MFATLLLLSAAGTASSLGKQLRAKLLTISITHQTGILTQDLYYLIWLSASGKKFRVAVVGGGPSGACAAEALARNPNIECVLFERKMDNAKPCGGAIPVCMVEEFNLPSSIIDRKVQLARITPPTFLRERKITHRLSRFQKLIKLFTPSVC